MKKSEVLQIHPDLVISREAAIDRLGQTANKSLEKNRPNATKQIQIVRAEARKLCPAYRNCRNEDWCFLCSSGQNNQPLFRGSVCLDCKLLTSDALVDNKIHNKISEEPVADEGPSTKA